jgi:iron(III) transport system permease protein
VHHTSRKSSARPVLAGTLVFVTMLPVACALGMCLSAEGRESFLYWWRDTRGWSILLRSMLFAGFAATVGMLFGWLVALAVPEGRSWTRIFLLLSCVPLLVPSSLVGVGWIMAMGRDAVVGNLLRPFVKDWTPTVYDWRMAASATGLRYFGVAALILWIARKGQRDLRAVEKVFALPPAARLRLRVVPMIVPAVASWLLLVLLIQSDAILPGLFLVPTFGTQVLIQFNALMDPAGAAALVVVPAALAGVALWLVLNFSRSQSGWNQSDSIAPASKDSARISLWRVTLLMVIFCVAVAVPLTGIVVRAASLSNLFDAYRGSRAEVPHSFYLASVGSALTVVLAAPLAHVWLDAYREREGSIVPILLLNAAVPGSLLALGLIMMFQFPVLRGLRDTEVPLLFGYAVRFAPLAMLVLLSSWLRQSGMPGLAAELYRIPRLQRFLWITIPTRARAVGIALLLVALLIAAELEISLILVRPGTTTLGVRLYTLIHTAPDHVVAALAVDALLVFGGCALLFLALSRLGTRLLKKVSQ